MKLFKNLFSIKYENEHRVLSILGIKIKTKYSFIKHETEMAIKKQNLYDLTNYKNANKIVVFVVVDVHKMCGGQMSLFSLCEHSKKILEPEIPVLITTIPGKYTYAHNDYFENDLNICRWEQIIDVIKNKEQVILHIPEVNIMNPFDGSETFYNRLTEQDKNVLRSIPDLQINIVNQQIELMPDVKIINNLRNLTSNITQTTAHDRYSTQEICNKFGIPLHKFSVNLDLLRYDYLSSASKEKKIIISPDRPLYFNVEKFVNNILRKRLPDYQIIYFYRMSFTQCMELTAKSFMTISFGEGMDGYLIHPLFVNSLGAAVYNEKFFPDKSWLKYRNIYESYEDLCEKIVDDIRYFEENPDEYYSLIQKQKEQIMKIYNIEEYKDNIKRFYLRQYDYYPDTEKSSGALNEVTV